MKKILLVVLAFFVAAQLMAAKPVFARSYEEERDSRRSRQTRENQEKRQPSREDNEREESRDRTERRRPSYGNIRPGSTHFVRIVRVVDGDTIMVTFSNGGNPERVRMIGVDTPESVRPGTPVQEYAKEASHYTATMLSNRDVWLQFDVGVRDRYGRFLAYVWTEKPQDLYDEEEIRWQMFNARLILEGYAQAMTVQPNSRYARLFTKFQREARNESRGLWFRY